MVDKASIGMFIIGIGLGTYIPTNFPAPINILDTWFGLILIALGIVLIAKN